MTGHDTSYVILRLGIIEMVMLPLTLLLPLLVCAIFVHPLSKAFLAGITSARDPEHRLTPQSPWYFFHLHYDPVATRARNKFVPGFALLCFAAFVLQAFSPTSIWVAFLTTEAVAFMLVATTGAAMYIVIHYAPRFDNPTALTLLSLLIGMVATFISYLVGVVLVMSFGYLVFDSTNALLVQGVLVAPVILAVMFASKCIRDWARIRSSPTHEWFRLED